MWKNNINKYKRGKINLKTKLCFYNTHGIRKTEEIMWDDNQ